MFQNTYKELAASTLLKKDFFSWNRIAEVHSWVGKYIYFGGMATGAL